MEPALSERRKAVATRERMAEMRVNIDIEWIGF
jgi:hypothetical protein